MAAEMFAPDDESTPGAPDSCARLPDGPTLRPVPVQPERRDDPHRPDPWRDVEVVPIRPLDGVTEVVGADLAAGLLVDPTTLSPSQLVELATGAERLKRWCESVQLAAIGELALYGSPSLPQDEPVPNIGHSPCDAHQLTGCPQCHENTCGGAACGDSACYSCGTGEPSRGRERTVEVGFTTPEEVGEFLTVGVSAALSISPSAADKLVSAAFLVRQAPRIRAALETGRCDLERIQVIRRELNPVRGRPGARQLAEQLVVDHSELTVKKFRDRVRSEVISLQGDDRAHQEERAQRRIWFSADEAGMATIGAYLPAEDARLAFDTITSLAYQQHADAEAAEGPCQDQRDGELCSRHGGIRSLDNRRADAFMEWIHSVHNGFIDPATGEFDDCTGDPERHRRRAKPHDVSRVMLHLHMNASTAADVDDHAANLMGYGPISAEHARRICENATLVRILTDPVTNKVTAMDTPAYKVPKLLRWSVIARDGYCIFPTCDRPAHTGEIDHLEPHPGGRSRNKELAEGLTTFDNLGSECTYHHRVKTHGGWTVHDCGDGWIEWESPTGHRYRRGPDFVPRTIMNTPEGRELKRKRSGPWYQSIPPKAPMPKKGDPGETAGRSVKPLPALGSRGMLSGPESTAGPESSQQSQSAQQPSSSRNAQSTRKIESSRKLGSTKVSHPSRTPGSTRKAPHSRSASRQSPSGAPREDDAPPF